MESEQDWKEQNFVDNPAEVKPNAGSRFAWINGWMVVVLISAWMIGMGIVIAGWLISKEVSQSSTVKPAPQSEPASSEPDLSRLDIPGHLPILGDGSAKVTVVEFADYQCPYCLRWFKEIFPRFKQEYIDTGKVRFLFWDFPFLSQESTNAAVAATCAGRQGKYWPYHDALFLAKAQNTDTEFDEAFLTKTAGGLSLDQKLFQSCYRSSEVNDLVRNTFEYASSQGVTSTPTLMINKQAHEGLGSWEKLRTILDQQLKGN